MHENAFAFKVLFQNVPTKQLDVPQKINADLQQVELGINLACMMHNDYNVKATLACVLFQ